MDYIFADLIAFIVYIFMFVMICAVYIIPLFIAVFSTIGWIWMLVDVIQRDESTFKDSNGKLLWVLIMVLGGGIGALIYYFLEYREYKKPSYK